MLIFYLLRWYPVPGHFKQSYLDIGLSNCRNHIIRWIVLDWQLYHVVRIVSLDKNERYGDFLKQHFNISSKQLFISVSCFEVMYVMILFRLVGSQLRSLNCSSLNINCAPPLKLANWLFQAKRDGGINYSLNIKASLRLKYFGHGRYFAALLKEYVIILYSFR